MLDFSGIFGVERFKIWCQKVLPTVYDDSLSYMELLCKVLKVLEEYGKGSSEIAKQVVLLNEELEKAKEDIAQITENGGKTDEQVGANTDAIAGLGERVTGIEQQIVSIAETIVTVRDNITALGERVSETEQQVVTMGENLESLGDTVNTKIGGKTAYLGEYVNMEDIPADAVIVGGNGTEEEPYNAFEAGGSKEHGGWVRVGEEFVTESDFKKLEEILSGERGVEKAVMADRITTIDLSQYNDTDNIPVEFARAIGDDKCYAFILVQSGSLYPPCLYYISNDDGITQIAGRVNNALITRQEDYYAPEKTYSFYCGKLGYKFPQITVLAFNGNINFFVGEKRTNENFVENSKYLYFGKHLINDENATTLENFSRGANGLTFGQAETLKTFAVGETFSQKLTASSAPDPGAMLFTSEELYAFVGHICYIEVDIHFLTPGDDSQTKHCGIINMVDSDIICSYAKLSNEITVETNSGVVAVNDTQNRFVDSSTVTLTLRKLY